jgi:hypothetical protein
MQNDSRLWGLPNSLAIKEPGENTYFIYKAIMSQWIGSSGHRGHAVMKLDT